MGYYDDPSPQPIHRRVSTDPKPNKNVNITKKVTVGIKSLNEVEVGDQREPRKSHVTAEVSSGDHAGVRTVQFKFPSTSTAKYGLDDMIDALQTLKRSL